MMWKNIKVIIGRREKSERTRDTKFCLWSIFWSDGEVGKWEVKKMVRNDFEKEPFDNHIWYKERNLINKFGCSELFCFWQNITCWKFWVFWYSFPLIKASPNKEFTVTIAAVIIIGPDNWLRCKITKLWLLWVKAREVHQRFPKLQIFSKQHHKVMPKKTLVNEDLFSKKDLGINNPNK